MAGLPCPPCRSTNERKAVFIPSDGNGACFLSSCCILTGRIAFIIHNHVSYIPFFVCPNLECNLNSNSIFELVEFTDVMKYGHCCALGIVTGSVWQLGLKVDAISRDNPERVSAPPLLAPTPAPVRQPGPIPPDPQNRQTVAPWPPGSPRPRNPRGRPPPRRREVGRERPLHWVGSDARDSCPCYVVFSRMGRGVDHSCPLYNFLP